MREIAFKCWLCENGYEKKSASDAISRLKRFEKELGFIDIDQEYKRDEAEKLLSCFAKKGENEAMKSYAPKNLPVGKYSLSTYKYALKIYIEF